MYAFKAFILYHHCCLFLGSATFSELWFTVEPSDIVVLKDKPAMLECAVHCSIESPPVIRWLRDKSPVPLTNGR